ncbi:MAG: HEAT repeat domain-containing protein, partial [Planctomycetota bacterium]
FTADNNSDNIDEARFHLLLPGSDSGWRYSYQWLEQPVARGPWVAEEMWKPVEDCENGPQPKWFVPPIANVSHGPSGLVFDTGIGLSHEWRDHFFLCDFRGGSTYSGILAFDVKPKGAFFELGKVDRFAWQVLPTDVDFAPDGSMLLLDWTEGWEKPGKGRIHRIDHKAPDDATKGAMQASAERLAAGFADLKPEELGELLSSADRRLRLGAQLELCDRRDSAVFEKTLSSGKSELAMLHSVWWLGLLLRRGELGFELLLEAVVDMAQPDRVRAQIARVLGEASGEMVQASLIAAMADESPVVRAEAAMAVANHGHGPGAFEAAVAFARSNGSADPVLFHAAVRAIESTGDVESIAALHSDESTAVRHAAVIALRRARSPHLVEFLGDASLEIVAEASRAIYDEDVALAMPALAKRLGMGHFISEIDARRVLYASWRTEANRTIFPEHPNSSEGERVGTSFCSGFVTLAFAPGVLSDSVRAEALDICLKWSSPPEL